MGSINSFKQNKRIGAVQINRKMAIFNLIQFYGKFNFFLFFMCIYCSHFWSTKKHTGNTALVNVLKNTNLIRLVLLITNSYNSYSGYSKCDTHHKCTVVCLCHNKEASQSWGSAVCETWEIIRTHLLLFHLQWAAWTVWCLWRCRGKAPPCRFHF